MLGSKAPEVLVFMFIQGSSDHVQQVSRIAATPPAIDWRIYRNFDFPTVDEHLLLEEDCYRNPFCPERISCVCQSQSLAFPRNIIWGLGDRVRVLSLFKFQVRLLQLGSLSCSTNPIQSTALSHRLRESTIYDFMITTNGWRASSYFARNAFETSTLIGMQSLSDSNTIVHRCASVCPPISHISFTVDTFLLVKEHASLSVCRLHGTCGI